MRHAGSLSPSIDVGDLAITPATHSFGRLLSYAEEPEFIPAYRVYLSGCNFRCRFCNVAPGCFIPDQGTPVKAAALARDCEAAVATGARSINLLGGEPTLHTRTILELAAAAQYPLPLVLNTNGFFSAHTRDALAGVIHTWLLDFKFGNDDCAARLAGIDEYIATVTPNIEALYADGRLHVRHLLMPGHVDCCFVPVVDWLCANTPGVRFHLMTGYVPAWRAMRDVVLGRLLDRDTVRRAAAYLQEKKLNWSTDPDAAACAKKRIG